MDMSSTDSLGGITAVSRARQGIDRARAPRGLRGSAWAIPTHVLLIMFLLVAVIPFIIIVFAAFKTKAEIVQVGFSLPEVWRWSNFADAWTQARFALYFRSSVIAVVAVVIGSTLPSILSGYAFGRTYFRLSGVLFFVFLLGIMVPQEAFTIPLYHNLRKLGLLDTYWALILPQIGMSVCFGTLWMRGFFDEVPRDLVDAAMVDGCTSWDTLRRVLFPIARPAILTMVVLFLVWTWNDFLLVLVLASSDEVRTLPLGLAFFQGRYSVEWNLFMAATLVSILPILIVYFFAQRHLIGGIASFGLKG